MLIPGNANLLEVLNNLVILCTQLLFYVCNVLRKLRTQCYFLHVKLNNEVPFVALGISKLGGEPEMGFPAYQSS